MAIALGRFLWEVDELTRSELRTWSDFDDEFAGLMLPSEAAGMVAAASANFSGNTKEYLDPEQFIPIHSPARLEEFQRRRELRVENQMRQQAIVDRLNAVKDSAVREEAKKRAKAKAKGPKQHKLI